MLLEDTFSDMNAAGLLLRICAQGSGRSLILIRDNVALQSVQVTGTRLQHSKSRPTSSQGVPQPGQADPFTSSLQSKTEKELLEQVLRQAQQEEAAEEAAEQVCVFLHQL